MPCSLLASNLWKITTSTNESTNDYNGKDYNSNQVTRIIPYNDNIIYYSVYGCYDLPNKPNTDILYFKSKYVC